MTADLVAFLRTRLDDDERAAKAAMTRQHVTDRRQLESGHTMVTIRKLDEPDLGQRWAAGDDGHIYAHRGLDSPTRCDEHPAGMPNMCDDVVVLEVDDQAADIEEGVLAHVARWDPARVLAEVAAKRAILDAWDAVRAEPDGSNEEQAGRESALYNAARLLAQPYAGHPEFHPSWATS